MKKARRTGSDNVVSKGEFCPGVPGVTIKGDVDGQPSYSLQLDLTAKLSLAQVKKAVAFIHADAIAKGETTVDAEVALYTARQVNTDARNDAARKTAADADLVRKATKEAKSADDEIAAAMLKAKEAILAERARKLAEDTDKSSD